MRRVNLILTICFFFFFTIRSDEELLAAAAWYQEGLSRPICEEYLNDDHRPIGSFLLRRSYTYAQYPFVLSIRTNVASVEHFLIERTPDEHAYRLKVRFLLSNRRPEDNTSHVFDLGLFKTIRQLEHTCSPSHSHPGYASCHTRVDTFERDAASSIAYDPSCAILIVVAALLCVYSVCIY